MSRTEESNLHDMSMNKTSPNLGVLMNTDLKGAIRNGGDEVSGYDQTPDRMKLASIIKWD